MNYSYLSSKEVEIYIRPPKSLLYNEWKATGFITKTLKGVVLTGTFGVVVIEESDTGKIYRINDELIVYLREL